MQHRINQKLCIKAEKEEAINDYHEFVILSHEGNLKTPTTMGGKHKDHLHFSWNTELSIDIHKSTR